MTNKYDDIINLPHYVSATRPRMAMIDRAAQFSPFAALTGHGAAIKETARRTDERIELDEYLKENLGNRLQMIAENIEKHYEIEITYFEPDDRKSGGAYLTTDGIVKKINEYGRIVILMSGEEIPIDEIISIEGKIFESVEYDLYED